MTPDALRPHLLQQLKKLDLENACPFLKEKLMSQQLGVPELDTQKN